MSKVWEGAEKALPGLGLLLREEAEPAAAEEQLLRQATVCCKDKKQPPFAEKARKETAGR